MPVGFLPVLLLARTGNMVFELLIIENGKDLLFGIPENQNIVIEICEYVLIRNRRGTKIRRFMV